MKKLRLWYLKRKLNNIAYEIALYRLQIEYKKMGQGCFQYLTKRLNKKYEKVNNKIRALEN